MILAYLYGKNSLKDKTGEKILTDERLYERYFLGEKEAASKRLSSCSKNSSISNGIGQPI